jgi:HSP20 family protein
MKKYGFSKYDQVFEDFYPEVKNLLGSFVKPITNTEYTPKWDVVKKDDKYEVNVVLPGAGEENVDVNIENNILIISYTDKEHKNKFIKTNDFDIKLDMDYEDINFDNIKATLKNGILTVDIPIIKAKKNNIKIKLE